MVRVSTYGDTRVQRVNGVAGNLGEGDERAMEMKYGRRRGLNLGCYEPPRYRILSRQKRLPFER